MFYLKIYTNLPPLSSPPILLSSSPSSLRPDRNNLTQPRVNIATDPWGASMFSARLVVATRLLFREKVSSIPRARSGLIFSDRPAGDRMTWQHDIIRSQQSQLPAVWPPLFHNRRKRLLASFLRFFFYTNEHKAQFRPDIFPFFFSRWFPHFLALTRYWAVRELVNLYIIFLNA